MAGTVARNANRFEASFCGVPISGSAFFPACITKSRSSRLFGDLLPAPCFKHPELGRDLDQRDIAWEHS